ncbi:ATP-binding protein [Rhodoligotrophos ferricapiens]|uniref:ATP-binding protein n=1 Tax=Rhodoligotrophos ferricapiens TaxID=3069264 RepID=UPI00315D3891
MALKITRASDPITVERLNTVIYGPPGLGKTSLAFTAEAPLLLDFDNGSHRAANRKDAVLVSDWSDVAEMTADDLEPFKTIIVDTAGRALDVLTADIIKTNPKLGRGGALTLQGYGELKSRFTSFLKLLNSFGKDVVLIAHMDEQRSGDDIVERLDVQGGSKGEIYKAADAMGRLVLANGKRRLLFSPTDAAFGKNPGQLEPLLVPETSSPSFDGFLASVIQRIKDRLNEMTEAQREAMAEQQWFRDTLPEVADADAINALIERANAAGPACKVMLHNRAKEIGLIFDKSEGCYAEKQKAESEAA